MNQHDEVKMKMKEEKKKKVIKEVFSKSQTRKKHEFCLNLVIIVDKKEFKKELPNREHTQMRIVKKTTKNFRLEETHKFFISNSHHTRTCIVSS
jgi:hypothetical protein